MVTAVAVVALLTGAGAAAAADWLQIFRTEKIAPVTVTRADLVELPDLSAYGEVEVIDEVDVREVADAAAAEEATGLSVPQVNELPHGVTGDPTFQVGRQVSGVFTFSAEAAARAAAAVGETLPPPPGLDGSRSEWTPAPGSPRSGRQRRRGAVGGPRAATAVTTGFAGSPSCSTPTSSRGGAGLRPRRHPRQGPGRRLRQPGGGLLLSTVISPMASGVVAVGLFGATWIAGVVGGVGEAIGNEGVARVGTVSHMLLPTDGLWRGPCTPSRTRSRWRSSAAPRSRAASRS